MNNLPPQNNRSIVKVGMYEVSRLGYVCRNVIAMLEMAENGFEVERLPLIRKAMSEYFIEFQARYNELVKEFDRISQQ